MSAPSRSRRCWIDNSALLKVTRYKSERARYLLLYRKTKLFSLSVVSPNKLDSNFNNFARQCVKLICLFIKCLCEKYNGNCAAKDGLVLKKKIHLAMLPERHWCYGVHQRRKATAPKIAVFVFYIWSSRKIRFSDFISWKFFIHTHQNLCDSWWLLLSFGY